MVNFQKNFWSLFIDDERYPSDQSLLNWTIARSFDEVQQFVNQYGFPSYISFDHDLGSDVPNGDQIAKWLIDYLLDRDQKFPADFQFIVHSMNPVGAKNIYERMKSAVNYIGCYESTSF